MRVEDILLNPIIPTMCFAEADADIEGGAQPEPEAVDPLEAALAEDEPPVDEDEAELDIGPEKIKVKKVVKDAWDGLQKSVQQRAEETKAEKAAVAAERERVREFQQNFEAISNEMAEIKAIDKQAEPYLKLTASDWMAWAEQDPDAARKAQTGLQALLMQRTQLVNTAQGKVQQIQQKNAAAQAEAKAKADIDIAKEIADWTPAKRSELVAAVAKETGFSADEIEPLTYRSGAVKILQDAIAYRALKAKVAAKNNAPPTPKTEPQPKAPSSRGGGGNPLGDNVPPEQWAKNFYKMRRGG